MGLELLAQPESPVGLRLSLDKTQRNYSRMAGNRMRSQPRIERESSDGRPVAAGLVYPWNHVWGAMATTWVLAPWALTAGAAEPARIDPAALSARIAGMMTDRLMRMTPPWRLPRSGACN
jgi:hypothetical protein